MQRTEKRLDDSLHPNEAALRNSGHPHLLLGQLCIAAWQVDPRDLEEGDTLVADLGVSPRCLDQGRQELRAHHRELDSDGLE